jgi:hypothetical protein
MNVIPLESTYLEDQGGDQRCVELTQAHVQWQALVSVVLNIELRYHKWCLVS